MTLDYGRSERRRPLRWLTLGVSLLLLVLCSYQYGASAWEELRFLVRQRQWASCTIPRGTVVFDTGSHALPYIDDFTREQILPLRGCVPEPRMTFPVARTMGWCSTPFLHELLSPSGHRRTVCIDVIGYDVISRAGERSRVVWLHTKVCTPGWRPHDCVDPNEPWVVDCPLTARIQFFAGEADPDDPSHFIIPYLCDGIPGRLDGFLKDDDGIRLVPDRGAGGGPDPWRGWSPAALQPVCGKN